MTYLGTEGAGLRSGMKGLRLCLMEGQIEDEGEGEGGGQGRTAAENP